MVALYRQWLDLAPATAILSHTHAYLWRCGLYADLALLSARATGEQKLAGVDFLDRRAVDRLWTRSTLCSDEFQLSGVG